MINILECWFVGPSIFFLFKQVLLCCRATWLRKTPMSFSTHAFSKHQSKSSTNSKIKYTGMDRATDQTNRLRFRSREILNYLVETRGYNETCGEV